MNKAVSAHADKLFCVQILKYTKNNLLPLHQIREKFRKPQPRLG